MPTVFNALPGIEVPAGAINKTLDSMWAGAAAGGRPSPANDDAKATQINLVLHLGFGTSCEDATAQFQTAVNFSRRYPCRVVVLCPLPLDDTSTDQIRAKVYGECHLGKTKGDTRCVEFVALSYPFIARRFLESQVSTCLSTDLPLYYWVHRFSSYKRLNDYQYLLLNSKRTILDSAIIHEGLGAYAWPRPQALRDLAHARTLTIRQAVGQFLSACPPEELVANIAGICIAHSDKYSSEAATLLAWLRDRLHACGMNENVAGSLEAAKKDAAPLSIRFDYKGNERRFHWEGDPVAGTSQIDASLCHGPVKMNAPFALLTPEAALGEAMFF